MKNQLRAIGDFWRQEYGRFVGMTAIAFLVLILILIIRPTGILGERTADKL